MTRDEHPADARPAAPHEADVHAAEGGHDEEEFQDDAVIGQVFRRSLGIMAAVGLLVALLVFWLSREDEPGEETHIETSAPEVVAEAPIEVPALPFTDVTAAAGIDFVHENGATDEKLLPETMGSGAVFFDADLDGDPDLFLPNGTAWQHVPDRRPASSAYYRNDRMGPGGAPRFVDLTDEVGLTTDLYATGAAVGDVDGDGRLDLFVATVGGNRLYRNTEGPDGAPRFVDVTGAAGVAGAPDMWSTSAAFVDIDRDGDLDLFVGNYVRWSRQIDAEVDYRLTGVGRAYGPPVNYQGTFSYLYRNDSQDGTTRFTDISAEAGIQIRNPATDVPVGKALGIAPVDIDADGHIDLMVANDTVQNFLFHNRGDGTFEEMGELYGLAYGRAGEATGAMGIDAGHYRNDDDLGFAIGNFANEMTSLYMSQGEATLFVDEAITDGVGAPSRTLLTFGLLMLDVDLDGRLDILSTNGHLESQISVVDPSQSFTQPSQLFWNAGSESRSTYLEVPLDATGDLAKRLVGRGSAYADIDGDGDLDVILTQAGLAPLLLRNDQALGHSWLRVSLRAPGSADPFAIGAWVELEAEGAVQRRRVMPTRSYQSQSELVLTFGLGEAETLDRIEVHWPDGAVESVDPAGIALGSEIRIERSI